MLEAAGTPVLRTRAARITYVERRGAAPLTRNALLIEDDRDARTRARAHEEIPMESFGHAAARGVSGQNAGLIAFGEALVGNFDWCLQVRAGRHVPVRRQQAALEHPGVRDRQRRHVDDERFRPRRGRRRPAPLVRQGLEPCCFVESHSRVQIEVLSQVQRTRSLFSRTDLDELRRHFVERRTAVYAAIDGAPVDSGGRGLARSYADAFYDAIQSDAAFYRPIVAASDVRVFLDPRQMREACGSGDVMRAGTPVNPIARSGGMSRVVMLDALWRWADTRECDDVQNGPVWIRSDAITREYPGA